MNILFLCRQKDLGFGQVSLARALERRGVCVTCVEDDTEPDEDITKLLARHTERPSLILQPELDLPLLPQGLADIDIPTACLHIDTYAYTERRIRWSMLFDHPIVYHPGYRARFERAGHPGAITFYHAACRDLFDKPPVDRIFDVASVGRTHNSVQGTRRRVMTALKGRFRLNEWEKWYSYEEMAEVYRHSKIVVNVARDDFPQDANMRAFEAMAAGCLLISRVPTELTEIGFQEGVHFVGYRNESEIIGLISEYLSQSADPHRIAEAGREKVLREHTYDNRASFLLERIEESAGRFYAPARKWPEWRTRTNYIDYYAANRVFECAHTQWRQLATSSPWHALKGGSVVGRAWLAEMRRRVGSVKKTQASKVESDGFRINER
jgi:hypothetical protein